jgi:transposase
VQTSDRQRHPLGGWIPNLEQRMHRNKVIVGLATKIAWVAWKILIKPHEIYAALKPENSSSNVGCAES